MRLRPGLLVRKESFGGMVFDVQRMGMWVVNETAAMVLLLCEAGQSREAIAQAVAEEYGCEEARADVAAFLDSAFEGGLVLED